jgi:hypothetical protein
MIDLRIVRFRAYELGIIAEPPPCQLQEGKGSTGCWCYLEPAAKRNSAGTLQSRSCPPRPQDVPSPVVVNVSWDET